MSEEEDYADLDRPPPGRWFREHWVSLRVGFVFMFVICGGTCIVFLIAALT